MGGKDVSAFFPTLCQDPHGVSWTELPSQQRRPVPCSPQHCLWTPAFCSWWCRSCKLATTGQGDASKGSLHKEGFISSQVSCLIQPTVNRILFSYLYIFRYFTTKAVVSVESTREFWRLYMCRLHSEECFCSEQLSLFWINLWLSVLGVVCSCCFFSWCVGI